MVAQLQKLSKIEVTAINEQANVYAQQSLIPSSYWDDFKENYTPLTDELIYAFSNKYHINPAIVLGRACFEKNNYGVKTKIDKTLR